MGKPTTKKKNQRGTTTDHGNTKQSRASERNSKSVDEDTTIFINISQELKEEGNKLFQKHDHEGAMLKYEKAIKLLPENHIDIAYLRTNMAACYMQMGIGEYPRAVNECNLALKVVPKYSKGLLRRARCYEALNRLDLSLMDVNNVLSMEPNNSTALEISDSLRKAIEEKRLQFEDKEVVLPSDGVDPAYATVSRKDVKEKARKKKSAKLERKVIEEAEEKNASEAEEKNASEAEEKNASESEEKNPSESEEKNASEAEEKNASESEEKNPSESEEKNPSESEVENASETEEKDPEDKIVAEAKTSVKEEQKVMRSVKLVHGEDIRWAQLPLDCGVRLVRDIVIDRFPSLKGVLIKYRDQEGDLVTITTTDELRGAEELADSQVYLRLYVVEVSPDKEPPYEGIGIEEGRHKSTEKPSLETCNVNSYKGPSYAEDWIIHFARLFKNHVGFECDSYLDLHETGIKLYSIAMEDTVTSEDAQDLFDMAATKFQEMVALALFNWGNVHLSKARKRVSFSEDSSAESSLMQVEVSYHWAQKEYEKAGLRYEEAVKVKPDFYEGLLALGLQQFEQAKLSWYYIVGKRCDLEIGQSTRVLEFYNKAEDSIEKGMQLWEEMEEQRLNGLSKYEKDKAGLRKFGLDDPFNDISEDEASKQAENMRCQIYLLWGTILYERSVVEYKLILPTWEECLEVAVEKFELAGASQTGIAFMIKNHCSNETALQGFKADEIVQAWNEMDEADRWRAGYSSSRLEPLFRRRPSKLHSVLEHL